MIPEERREAVARGLRAAFGSDSIEDMQRMTGGLTSNLVFRAVVRGHPYLLRIIMRKDDASRHYANMRAAAQAGLAPRVWYTNAEDKVSIADFVQHVPFPMADGCLRPCERYMR